MVVDSDAHCFTLYLEGGVADMPPGLTGTVGLPVGAAAGLVPTLPAMSIEEIPQPFPRGAKLIKRVNQTRDTHGDPYGWFTQGPTFWRDHLDGLREAFRAQDLHRTEWLLGKLLSTMRGLAESHVPEDFLEKDDVLRRLPATMDRAPSQAVLDLGHRGVVLGADAGQLAVESGQLPALFSREFALGWQLAAQPFGLAVVGREPFPVRAFCSASDDQIRGRPLRGASISGVSGTSSSTVWASGSRPSGRGDWSGCGRRAIAHHLGGRDERAVHTLW
jgi:hypothetical protein